VNQSLVDDGLVDKEKISGANYFWSFPAKKDHLAQVEHRQTLAEIEKLKLQAEQAACKLADAKRGREDTATTTTTVCDEENSSSRPKKLARLAEMAREKAALETELASLKENDPAALADLQKELKLVTQAAHRWTDNIFQCKTYLIKKRGMDKKEVVRIV
jgi:Leucine zipper with capping helix domain/Mnd1 HTH domain